MLRGAGRFVAVATERGHAICGDGRGQSLDAGHIEAQHEVHDSTLILACLRWALSPHRLRRRSGPRHDWLGIVNWIRRGFYLIRSWPEALLGWVSLGDGSTHIATVAPRQCGSGCLGVVLAYLTAPVARLWPEPSLRCRNEPSVSCSILGLRSLGLNPTRRRRSNPKE